ncbi:MAG: permease [Methanomassiliicoccales archaeon]
MANPLVDALIAGLSNVMNYLSEHTLTCLIPAFFIAGAIAAFVKKDAILRYFGPTVKRYKSYSVASVSGAVLAVCSCTILPLFAGIYRKGSGIGPAITFLFAGPGINILAIVYTAQVLGYDLGFARAASAVALSIIVGLIMATIFKRHDVSLIQEKKEFLPASSANSRPRWASAMFFVILILILIIAASKIDWVLKLATVYLLTVVIAALLIYYFERDEVTNWAYETWDLTKKIFPILIAGTFIVGIIAYFLPPEMFRPYLGNNSISSNLLASFIGAILYMPTLLEVPIIGTTFGYSSGVMAAGPALSLLLSGPTTSLPSIAVLYRIMGAKKTTIYWFTVVILSALAGFIYGMIVG